MKNILIILAICFAAASCSNQEENGKKAILMVHFGTTHDTTRALTIDAINSQMENAFRESDVFEAYTSRIVIKRLKERGIVKRTPVQILDSLKKAGYTSVTIQPTHIIPGKEYKMLVAEADSIKKEFKEIKVGKPLLFSDEDLNAVVEILEKRNPSSDPSHHILYVGHGTEDAATEVYVRADSLFNANSHVATIEGIPTLDDAIAKLKEAGAKKVTLVPFMFVAGDHAANDISVDWKNELESNGFQVELKLESLGQIPAIRNLFLQHILAERE
ncbi:MAG: sirohydrochlorin cobaltochelatase [Bacteroidales bacterium]|nr:sirohydrochlorin cobaltochelatase [Bacteroidales bacterium]